MRLKSLEVHGFKSFVDKTALRFERGITGVVGPNGCGKSNVVDAIRWAMGEQSPRRLRGRAMDDVIFGGSEGIAPVGMAEVILSFDNAGGDGPPAFAAYRELQVTRRLYRSGESEYLLNGTACRLRDVLDFFRDTGVGTKGYTIVEQGRIAEIVSAKPEERRSLIEEAAGIGKYKARRREAESKIKSTEQNLLRVSDVLGEIRRQINSIERQARKAGRYKRLRETLRVLELSIAREERDGLCARLADGRSRATALRDTQTALETQLAERELEVSRQQLERVESERLLSQGGEALLALRGEIKEAEGQIAYGRRERETLAEMAASRRQELERLSAQEGEQERQHDDAAAELAAMDRALAGEAEAVAAAEASAREAREALVGLERERDTSNAALVEVLTRIARSEDRAASIDDRRAELESRMRNADEGLALGQNEASQAGREQRDLEEGLRNLLAERDRLMGLHRHALEAHEAAAQHLRVVAERLREVRELRETRRARLGSLREVVERREDLGEATRHLLAQAPEAHRSQGLRGLLRDVLEVERDAERAVEAVLADRAEALVVQDTGGALAALDSLRRAGRGRGVFVALPPLEVQALGFVPLGRPLLDRVKARHGYEGLARSLFGQVNLVDSLDEVVRVYGRGSLPASFVTREGDLLSPDGTLRGGGTGEGAGRIARVGEIRELERETEQLDLRVVASQRELVAGEQQLARATDELENLRNRHHTAALAVANHEKDLERTRERVKALGEAHEGRVAERSDLLGELDALASERGRLTGLLEAARGERATRQRGLDAMGLRIGSAGREALRLETLATERRVEHAGRAQRRESLEQVRARLAAALAETRDWMRRREQEIRSAEERRELLARQIGEAERLLAERLRDEEAARTGHDARREAFERASAGLQALEEAARELRTGIARQREEVAAIDLSLRESELELQHLDGSMRERWDVELASWTAPRVESPPPGAEPAPEEPQLPGGLPLAPDPSALAAGEDEEEAAPDAAREARRNAELAALPLAERRRELEEQRRRLQALGEVNLGAIEEHEELQERFRFLSEQKADLDGTLASLREAIARINRTSRKRFRETFEEVSKRFSENFPRLFRGGKASLALTETEDVLEAGIEIMAQPPGKRLQNVNLLSGGEKTMTAIALLVAVFQVRPAPFFLLDEVDAALDDANVGRFNEMVLELARDSQFVLITHNKRTIEIADVLYGVTMERRGVSKLVAVELSQTPSASPG